MGAHLVNLNVSEILGDTSLILYHHHHLRDSQPAGMKGGSLKKIAQQNPLQGSKLKKHIVQLISGQVQGSGFSLKLRSPQQKQKNKLVSYSYCLRKIAGESSGLKHTRDSFTIIPPTPGSHFLPRFRKDLSDPSNYPIFSI